MFYQTSFDATYALSVQDQLVLRSHASCRIRPFGSPSWRVAAQGAKKTQMLLTKLRASDGLEKWTNGWSAIESSAALPELGGAAARLSMKSTWKLAIGYHIPDGRSRWTNWFPTLTVAQSTLGLAPAADS